MLETGLATLLLAQAPNDPKNNNTILLLLLIEFFLALYLGTAKFIGCYCIQIISGKYTTDTVHADPFPLVARALVFEYYCIVLLLFFRGESVG